MPTIQTKSTFSISSIFDDVSHLQLSSCSVTLVGYHTRYAYLFSFTPWYSPDRLQQIILLPTAPIILLRSSVYHRPPPYFRLQNYTTVGLPLSGHVLKTKIRLPVGHEYAKGRDLSRVLEGRTQLR
jgi:hypothetical protein